VSEKLITRQQLRLIGRPKGLVGIPQSRPRAYSGDKFVESETRRGVSCASWNSKSEIRFKGSFGVAFSAPFELREEFESFK
jgi:hypothetical protein